jgi:hypothetical protein
LCIHPVVPLLAPSDPHIPLGTPALLHVLFARDVQPDLNMTHPSPLCVPVVAAVHSCGVQHSCRPPLPSPLCCVSISSACMPSVKALSRTCLNQQQTTSALAREVLQRSAVDKAATNNAHSNTAWPPHTMRLPATHYTAPLQPKPHLRGRPGAPLAVCMATTLTTCQ